MTELLLHPATRHQLDAIIIGKPHAIIVSGESGSGKTTVAKHLVESLTGKSYDDNSYILHIMPEATSIGVESIRSIREFVSRKNSWSSRSATGHFTDKRRGNDKRSPKCSA